MADYGQDLPFGTFLTPDAASAAHVIELALVSESVGLDLVTVQDHPYQARFLDTWTLLSVIAAQTSSIRIAPNVANLPLRPPVVLARSIASLDILSNGRVELGLGSGAFWDAIAAVGGPRLRPAQAVDALAEAVDIIRAVWDVDGGALRHDGVHYRVVGAHPGPAPAHPVEIWLGAYKKRMLTLTCEQADGWLPSMGYADPEALGPLNSVIDEAAAAAGRDPASIRRLYNLNGRFGTGAGFLAGTATDWAEQLATLTLEQGMSGYLLGTDDADTIRRFGDEVAPAVRDLVAAERAEPTRARDEAIEAPTGESSGQPWSVVPTNDPGTRRANERVWEEDTRPTGPEPDPRRRYTAGERAAGQHLVDIHDGLRAELVQLHDVITQVERGSSKPARRAQSSTRWRCGRTIGRSARSVRRIAASSPGTTHWRTTASLRTCAAASLVLSRSSTGWRRSTR